MIVKRDNKSFILGVSWRIGQDKNDINKLLKDYTGKSKVILKSTENTWIGFGEDNIGGIAAALLFACVYPDLIIVEKLTDDKYWMCVIHAGWPTPGKDLIVDESQKHTLLMDWINFFPTAVVCGDIEGASNSSVDAWDKVISAIKNGDISKKQLRNICLRSSINKKKAFIYSSLSILFFIILFFIWNTYKPKETPREEIIRRQLEKNNTDEINRKKIIANENLVRQYHFQINNVKSTIINSIKHNNILSWLNFYKSLPFSVDGYRMNSMSCIVGNCQLEWVGHNKLLAEDKFNIFSKTKNIADYVNSKIEDKVIIIEEKNPLKLDVKNNLKDNVLKKIDQKAIVDSLMAKNNDTTKNISDYSINLDYSILVDERINDKNSTNENVFISDINIFKAKYFDNLSSKFDGKIPPIPIESSVMIKGIIDLNLPDRILAKAYNLSISFNGNQSINNVLLFDREFANEFNQYNVFLKWNSIKINCQKQGDSISANATVYILSSDYYKN